MKSPRNWTNEQELFDVITEALCNDDRMEQENFRITARDEEDGYGGNGYILIRTPDGRRFSLDLNEEL